MLKFNVPRKLRKQIINIIDDLVNKIAPGYLLPNFGFDYRTAIYKAAYKYLWREFGRGPVEKVNYRDEVFDFLRKSPSKEFFRGTEQLLKGVCERVHFQETIPEDIILNPFAGNELWSRKESDRDNHIRIFKETVERINHILSQNNAKYRYDLGGESVQMVRQDTRLDMPKEDSDIQEPDDNQIPERHQNQSRSESWNRKGYRIAVVGVIVAILVLCFGEGILIRPLRWVWNYLQTLQ